MVINFSWIIWTYSTTTFSWLNTVAKKYDGPITNSSGHRLNQLVSCECRNVYYFLMKQNTATHTLIRVSGSYLVCLLHFSNTLVVIHIGQLRAYPWMFSLLLSREKRRNINGDDFFAEFTRTTCPGTDFSDRTLNWIYTICVKWFLYGRLLHEFVQIDLVYMWHNNPPMYLHTFHLL